MDEGSIIIDINESNEIELIVMLDLNIKKLLERCWMKLGSASKSTSFISFMAIFNHLLSIPLSRRQGPVYLQSLTFRPNKLQFTQFENDCGMIFLSFGKNPHLLLVPPLIFFPFQGLLKGFFFNGTAFDLILFYFPLQSFA